MAHAKSEIARRALEPAAARPSARPYTARLRWVTCLATFPITDSPARDVRALWSAEAHRTCRVCVKPDERIGGRTQACVEALLLDEARRRLPPQRGARKAAENAWYPGSIFLQVLLSAAAICTVCASARRGRPDAPGAAAALRHAPRNSREAHFAHVVSVQHCDRVLPRVWFLRKALANDPAVPNDAHRHCKHDRRARTQNLYLPYDHRCGAVAASAWLRSPMTMALDSPTNARQG